MKKIVTILALAALASPAMAEPVRPSAAHLSGDRLGQPAPHDSKRSRKAGFVWWGVGGLAVIGGVIAAASSGHSGHSVSP